MRVTSLIRDESELLLEIKKMDKRVFLACLIANYTGAKFCEMKLLTVGELKQTYINLGQDQSLRVIPIHAQIREVIDELELTNTKYVLENKNGRKLSLIKVNRVIGQAANQLELENITFSSFRKTFGHVMCSLERNTEDISLIMGLRNKKVDLNSMFEVKNQEVCSNG